MIAFKNKNCLWLMSSLFLLLLLIPLIQYGRLGRLLMSLLVTMTFLGGIAAVSDKKKHVILAVMLMIPPTVVEWYTGAFYVEDPPIYLVSSFYHLPLYLFLTTLILRYIFRPGRVELDHLFGAISVYLLVGMFFSHVYVTVERLLPGSYSIAREIASGDVPLFVELNYFSFVTLTSLGYGDISPVGTEARSLAIIEAIFGILFIGAFVARIASTAYIPPAPPSTPTEGA